MKIISDDNFLGGTLTVMTKLNIKMTLGRLVIYDSLIDEFVTFTDTTICLPEDEFKPEVGAKIVKLKLARQYYNYVRRQNRLIINNCGKTLNTAQRNLEHINKKLKHIQYELKKF